MAPDISYVKFWRVFRERVGRQASPHQVTMKRFFKASGKNITVLIVLFLSALVRQGETAEKTAVSMNLPGLQTGAAPWSAEIPNLLPRLNAIKLPALSAEGTTLHIHQHLDILINGKPVTVSSGIGINEFAGFISPLHTHDLTGEIHVESDEVRDFTLGQFFDVWGLRFTQSCIGSYCADGTHSLRVYSNGNPVSGDPRMLLLSPRQEIAIVYGPAKTKPTVPSSYRFPPGM